MSVRPETYRLPARLFHWGMAVLILLTIPAGLIMVQEGISRPLQDTLFIFHKNVGVLLLIAVILRLAYRLRHPPPPLPESVRGLQRVAAELSHKALYLMLFVMPIAGYVRVKAGGFPIESLDALGMPSLVPRSDALAAAAQAVHFFGALAIIALIGIHFGAAMLHLLIKRDGVFFRMWPPFGDAAARD